MLEIQVRICVAFSLLFSIHVFGLRPVVEGAIELLPIY